VYDMLLVAGPLSTISKKLKLMVALLTGNVQEDLELCALPEISKLVTRGFVNYDSH
jgi:hypothetical protein